MKVKFLCRLLPHHKQQIDRLLPLNSEGRVREEMEAGVQVYKESGLPPFALLYEGEIVAGFFVLLYVEEDSEGALAAEGRFYIRGNEKAYAKHLIQSMKEEYEELRHLSVLSEEEVSFLADCSHYAEYFMRRSRASSTKVSDSFVKDTPNTEITVEENSILNHEDWGRVPLLVEPMDQTKEEELRFYLETLKGIFFMSDEAAVCHLKECFKDSGCKLYVVKIGEKMVGTCGAYLGTKSDTIFDIAICNTEQGKGYGRLLLSKFLQMLSDPLKDIILQVSTKSEAAYHLYEEYGFHTEQKLYFYVVW